MKCLILLSGGVDSTTLLWKVKKECGRDSVKAIVFDYHQRHRVEIAHAEALCGIAKVKSVKVNLVHYARAVATSALTNPEIPVPEGAYNEHGMATTVVPGRNMVMLAVAAGHAESIGFDTVAYAAHGGDHHLYPDCRPAFIKAMWHAISTSTDNRVALYAPFANMTKADIVRMGKTLAVPYEMTWSCYAGGEEQCGRCSTCIERNAAFEEAGIQQ